MKYQILEGIDTADVAYKAWGKTAEELFNNCAEAVMQTMAVPATVAPLRNFKFQISNIKLDELLLDFLDELLFLKDTRQMLFSRFNLQIKRTDAKDYHLDANLWGEKINPKKHKLRCDVKAVTRYKFSLGKEKKSYVATIVLDI